MRIVRPKSIPHVDDDRLFASVAMCDDAIAADIPRGQIVRFAARRALYLFALRDRGHAVDPGAAHRDVCARLFDVDPITFRPSP